MKVFEHANAKINLFLDITGRMDNGFHEILSVMHSVTLNDNISIELFPVQSGRITVFVKGKYYLPCNNKNLAFRAVQAFSDAIKLPLSVRVGIHKKIPVSAGLAGGSSDAAAVLRALNKVNGNPFTTDKLCEIGEQLGSDVPYCILGRTQLCEGRGEKMKYIHFKNKLNFVVAVGDEYVSTASAYAKIDEMYGDFSDRELLSRQRLEKLLKAIEGSDIKTLCENMYNIFEDVILPECPQARALKQTMLENGALGAMMSGSGPSVFGVFESAEKAEQVASLIGENAHAVISV